MWVRRGGVVVAALAARRPQVPQLDRAVLRACGGRGRVRGCSLSLRCVRTCCFG
jgi:hypothetical protein